MPLEIERKFLLAHDGWRRQISHSERLRDGLVAASDGMKVRVRVSAGKATLAVKSKQLDGVRHEYEYEIPLAHALELLELHCGDRILDKTRHHVDHQGFRWEVDVYEGPLQGVILAEVELSDRSIEVALPDWIGEEVTDRTEFKKINMLRARMKQAS
jgi:adenylate cyclase